MLQLHQMLYDGGAGMLLFCVGGRCGDALFIFISATNLSGSNKWSESDDSFR